MYSLLNHSGISLSIWSISIKYKEISLINRGIVISWQDFQMYVLRFFTLASPPSVPFFEHEVPSVVNYMQIPKCGSATFSSFPSQRWCCHLKCGITMNITLSTWWMPSENQTSHEAQLSIFRNSTFWPFDKNLWKNHSSNQQFQVLYYLGGRKQLGKELIWLAWRCHLESLFHAVSPRVR